MSTTTISHRKIRDWARAHSAWPMQLVSHKKPIAIRLDMPGELDDLYLPVSAAPRKSTWAEFFAYFESNNLAFSWDDDDDHLDPSLAYHFIKRT
jgi:hypothetical protein